MAWNAIALYWIKAEKTWCFLEMSCVRAEIDRGILAIDRESLEMDRDF
jgi:hypothetical protein